MSGPVCLLTPIGSRPASPQPPASISHGCGCASCGGAKAGGGSCRNCHLLCPACKPIACSFCQEDERGPSRLCEACAHVCDSCQRTACAACRADFAACSSCGYSTCEECALQSQLAGGSSQQQQQAAGGSSRRGEPERAAGCGCWCAPPIRSASNVKHISSQRYQLQQLHPSLMAGSMEAAGLRDADDDDACYGCYDDYEEPNDCGGGGSSCSSGSYAFADELLHMQQHYQRHQQQLQLQQLRGSRSLPSSVEGCAGSSIFSVLDALAGNAAAAAAAGGIASAAAGVVGSSGHGCSSGIGLAALVPSPLGRSASSVGSPGSGSYPASGGQLLGGGAGASFAVSRHVPPAAPVRERRTIPV